MAEITLKKLDNINYDDTQLFRYMFRRYVRQLRLYDPSVTICEADVDEYLYKQKGTTILLASCTEVFSDIGFIVLGKNPENSPVGCDYYLQDFYINEKYQGMSWGKRVAEALFKKYPGKYFFYVLKKNRIARLFWGRVIEENGLQHFYLNIDKDHIYPNCICASYKTPKKKVENVEDDDEFWKEMLEKRMKEREGF